MSQHPAEDDSQTVIRQIEESVAQGDRSRALSLIALGVKKFKDDVAFLMWAGDSAHRLDAISVAADYFRMAQEAAPNHAPAYVAAIKMLTHARRPTEAAAVLAASDGRIVRDSGVLWVMAELAIAEARWSDCAQCLAEFRQLEPDNPLAYVRGVDPLFLADRLDEAEILAAECRHRFPSDLAALRAWAQLASRRANWQEAGRRWTEVVDHFPAEADAYISAAYAFDSLGQTADSDAILVRGMEYLADHFGLALAYAEAPTRNNLFDVSTARYIALRQRFPDHAETYLRGAIMLERSSRRDEAERWLTEGMTKCPDSAEVALRHAEVAIDTHNFEVAAQRLDDVRTKFPNFLPAYIKSAQIIGRHVDFDRAITILRQAALRWPNDHNILEETGKLYELRELWSEAEDNYRALINIYPNFSTGYLGIARIAAHSGDFEAAETALAEAIRRFPQEHRFWTARAEVATKRHQWREAAARWQETETRFPGETWISGNLMAARLALLEIEEQPPLATAQADETNLFMHFESLGGADEQGCEFGLIQRAFNAEPLGLLRWTSIEPDMLTEALESRFDCIGSNETTRVEIRSFINRREYCTIDLKLKTFMHNFIYTDEIDEKHATQRIFKRLKYLSRKLVEDLTDARKIFVYRLISRNLTDAELSRLHSAMRKYSDNTLLYVRYEDESHPNGTVVRRDDGLLIGYIDRFGFTASGARLVPATHSWHAICRRAYELWNNPDTDSGTS